MSVRTKNVLRESVAAILAITKLIVWVVATEFYFSLSLSHFLFISLSYTHTHISNKCSLSIPLTLSFSLSLTLSLSFSLTLSLSFSLLFFLSVDRYEWHFERHKFMEQSKRLALQRGTPLLNPILFYLNTLCPISFYSVWSYLFLAKHILSNFIPFYSILLFYSIQLVRIPLLYFFIASILFYYNRLYHILLYLIIFYLIPSYPIHSDYAVPYSKTSVSSFVCVLSPLYLRLTHLKWRSSIP